MQVFNESKPLDSSKTQVLTPVNLGLAMPHHNPPKTSYTCGEKFCYKVPSVPPSTLIPKSTSNQSCKPTNLSYIVHNPTNHHSMEKFVHKLNRNSHNPSKTKSIAQQIFICEFFRQIFELKTHGTNLIVTRFNHDSLKHKAY